MKPVGRGTSNELAHQCCGSEHQSSRAKAALPRRYSSTPSLNRCSRSGRHYAAYSHPYTEEDAVKFLEYSDLVWEKREGARFGIFVRKGERLCGGIGLAAHLEHNRAELGYWIGVPFWGNGYGTEAAREMLRFGFENLQLHRIDAGHFANNPASGHILRKLGMKHEGTTREHILKWDEYLDVEIYGLLVQEYREQTATQR